MTHKPAFGYNAAMCFTKIFWC